MFDNDDSNGFHEGRAAYRPPDDNGRDAADHLRYLTMQTLGRLYPTAILELRDTGLPLYRAVPKDYDWTLYPCAWDFERARRSLKIDKPYDPEWETPMPKKTAKAIYAVELMLRDWQSRYHWEDGWALEYLFDALVHWDFNSLARGTPIFPPHESGCISYAPGDCPANHKKGPKPFTFRKWDLSKTLDEYEDAYIEAATTHVREYLAVFRELYEARRIRHKRADGTYELRRAMVIAASKNDLTHVEWMVRFQMMDEPNWSALAREVGTTPSNLQNQVKPIARKIELTLRPVRPGRRKRVS